jgi:hypothetical protein
MWAGPCADARAGWVCHHKMTKVIQVWIVTFLFVRMVAEFGDGLFRDPRVSKLLVSLFCGFVAALVAAVYFLGVDRCDPGWPADIGPPSPPRVTTGPPPAPPAPPALPGGGPTS